VLPNLMYILMIGLMQWNYMPDHVFRTRAGRCIHRRRCTQRR
jgi:hypothetical protein